MELQQGGLSRRAVFKFTGAFMAWVIGSGFATGQEILQFFTSFGLWSYAAIAINLLFFLAIGYVLMTSGFAHSGEADFDHCRYYCGKRLGGFYSILMPLALLLSMPVLIAAAGAALHEYYGLNAAVGTALMAVATLLAYLAGFERMIRIVSLIGPVIIAFSLFIGIVTVIRDAGAFALVPHYQAELSKMQAAPHFLISAVLYPALNFPGGSAYYTTLGASAKSRREAKLGALLGAVGLIFSVAVVNTAILLNAGDVSALEIPTLFLAKKISPILGAAFSVVLLLGIFSSCSTMMWSVCHRIAPDGSKKGRLAAVLIALASFGLGLLPFSGLVGVLYPIIGAVSLPFVFCILRRGVLDARAARAPADEAAERPA